MEREAAPIRKIHVSDQGRFGTARIDATEQGLEALGYVIPNRVIGAALWDGLARLPGVQLIAPARSRSHHRESRYADSSSTKWMPSRGHCEPASSWRPTARTR